MQLASTPSVPSSPPGAPASFSTARLPHELQVARIGKGTVRSEVDRSIRVRLDGEGPPSERTLVADSKAAADLLASPSGPKFAKAVKSFLSIADPHVGKENLKSVTFVPDEHASKAVSLLNRIDRVARDGLNADRVLQPTRYQIDKVRKHVPDVSRAEIRSQLRTWRASELVKQLTAGEGEHVSFAAAWNSDGNIMITPDVSRDLLSTLGLYRLQPGDQTTKIPREYRDDQARESWHTALHEAQHSITPMKYRGPEWTSVMEEAIPEVLVPSAIEPTLHHADADIQRAARPARDTKHEAVNWSAWNRDHLPQPDAASKATAQGRYLDGPALVRDLLRMAKIDRRTTEGKATALELLQGRSSKFVPRRIADAIVSANGLPDSAAPKLADLIRQAAIGRRTLGAITDFIHEKA